MAAIFVAFWPRFQISWELNFWKLTELDRPSWRLTYSVRPRTKNLHIFLPSQWSHETNSDPWLDFCNVCVVNSPVSIFLVLIRAGSDNSHWSHEFSLNSHEFPTNFPLIPFFVKSSYLSKNILLLLNHALHYIAIPKIQTHGTYWDYD